MIAAAPPAVLAAQAADAFASIELAAPRPVGPGDALWLQVATGRLPPGARLSLSTETGQIIGGVAPFPPGSPTRATVPVPATALSGQTVRLRLQVTEPGAPPRAPRSGEVSRLQLTVISTAE